MLNRTFGSLEELKESPCTAGFFAILLRPAGQPRASWLSSAVLGDFRALSRRFDRMATMSTMQADAYALFLRVDVYFISFSYG